MKKRTIVTSALFALIVASSSVVIAGGFDSIYVFGDSISDQGNLYEASATLTGGAFGIPRADHYYLGRFTNGLNYADDLSEMLGLPLTPSDLDGGNNFAYGGTRTNYNIVEHHDAKPDWMVWSTYDATTGWMWLDQPDIFPSVYPWRLNSQRAAFVARGEDVSGALCVVASGSNDFRDFLIMAATNVGEFQTRYPTYAYNVLAGITGAVQDFGAHGAHDIVAANIPNLGVVPATLEYPGAADVATFLILPFNATLKTTLDDLEASEYLIDNDVNIIQLDAYSLLTDVVSNPDAYGFTNATDPCYTGFVGPFDDGDECANPEDYVFWDNEHLTTAAHAVLAKAVLETASLDMLDYLKGQVSRLNGSGSVKNSLNDKLDGAIQTLTDGNSGNDQAAIKKLKDFIKILSAKEGKQIPEDDAGSMIMRAEKVIALLEAGA